MSEHKIKMTGDIHIASPVKPKRRSKEETKLWQCFINGDRDAFKKLYAKYGNPVRT